jgi:hypothetical protein
LAGTKHSTKAARHGILMKKLVDGGLAVTLTALCI